VVRKCLTRKEAKVTVRSTSPWAACGGIVWRQGDAGEVCTERGPRWTSRLGDGFECRVEFRELAVQPGSEETDRKVRTEA